ncbi:hypothetical protein DFO73_101580 [Cytobacillus oceanisediminis]|uniref:Uncharacterized protein n=2 Tax=Cytobacillus oceanisediminis TaxID=665099 RepID=A0A2V3A6C0_9BACI|nr:hypothetical protein DFO73_101580 [Cytobacillus oceanisediminis]
MQLELSPEPLNEKVDLLIRNQIREYTNFIMKQIMEAKNGTVFSLNLNQVEAINASGTDEIIVKPIRWMQENIKEHDKYLYLKNLSGVTEFDHAYNIGTVLQYDKICVMVDDPTIPYLGYLGGSRDQMKTVLDQVYLHKIVTAKDVAIYTNKHVNTTSTQLSQLYKKRLIKREEEILPEGGRSYIYKSLF